MLEHFLAGITINMNKRVAIVDIDGCLTDYPNPVFFSFIKHKTGRDFDNLDDLKRKLGSDYENLKSLYRSSGLKRSLDLRTDAYKGLSYLRNCGFHIYIATSRPNRMDVVSDTHYWLNDLALPFDEIFFTGDKTKFHFCTFDRDVIIIDDEFKNISNYLGLTGVKIFHVTQEPSEGSDYSNYFPVSGWSDIIEHVKKV